MNTQIQKYYGTACIINCLADCTPYSSRFVYRLFSSLRIRLYWSTKECLSFHGWGDSRMVSGRLYSFPNSPNIGFDLNKPLYTSSVNTNSSRILFSSSESSHANITNISCWTSGVQALFLHFILIGTTNSLPVKVFVVYELCAYL